MSETSILIVTHEKDFVWLEWCLRGIDKFATGFKEVVIALPDTCPVPTFLLIPGKVPRRFWAGSEWPGGGMMWHMNVKMNADILCPSSDYILHLDSDCVFCEPVTPYDYLLAGKPMLMYARYDWICQRFNNQVFRHWQQNVQRCLGGSPTMEFMRRHPAVHYRELYPLARLAIHQFTGITCEDLMRGMSSVFPQDFCEFNTLGEVAWRHRRADYHWVNQEVGRPHDKLVEFWSHSPPDKLQELHWTDAPRRKFIPEEVIKEIFG